MCIFSKFQMGLAHAKHNQKMGISKLAENPHMNLL